MGTRKATQTAVVISILIIGALAASYYLWFKPVESDVEVEEFCFTVGYLDITASAPLFVLEAENKFADQGLCVETVKLMSSNQLIDALAAGRVDYIVETSLAPALALESHAPGRFYITAASEISVENPFDAILVREDSNLRNLEDLEGERISVFPGSTATSLLKDFLRSKNVTADTIEFVATPPTDMLAAVESGSADAAHVYEPAWTIGKEQLGLRELFGTVYGRQLSPNPQGVSLISTQVLENQPEESYKLISVFDETLHHMFFTNEDETRRILRQHFSLEEKVASKMNLLVMVPSSEIDWDTIAEYQELLFRNQELDDKVLLDRLKLPGRGSNTGR